MAKSPVHVVYLSYDGLTDPLGQSQIMPYLAGLSRCGFSFTIISFEKPSRFLALRQSVQTWCSNHDITWMPFSYHKNPPVLSTVYDLLVMWFALKKIRRSKEPRIIHCRSYLTSLIGVRAKRMWGVKFIFDMRGFWADERVEGKIWDLKNPMFRLIYNFFKARERTFLCEADHVVSLTENALREIRSWNLGKLRITVIPTCVDTERFDRYRFTTEQKTLLRQKLNLPKESFVLLYLGSWGTWYLTNEMLDLFKQVRELHPGAKFLIVTQDAVVIDNGEEHDQVVIVGNAKHADVPQYISIANAAVCFVKPSFSKKASSATKMGELMAMGVPVITNTGWGDVDYLFQNSCIVLRGFSPELLKAGVDQLRTDPPRNTAEAVERLSLSNGLDKYLSVYRDLE